tara:strand:- start:5567 stop:5791 length:225 start_codon:yes stop_codon:yes gene_type:complete
MDVQAAKLIGGGLIALSAFGAALGLGIYFSGYCAAVARNPEAKALLEDKFILMVAFIEALGMIALGLGAYMVTT